MNHIQLPQDGCGIIREDHLLQMVDDDLITTIRTQRCLDGLGDCSTRVDISQNGTIFALVAGLVWRCLVLWQRGHDHAGAYF